MQPAVPGRRPLRLSLAPVLSQPLSSVDGPAKSTAPAETKVQATPFATTVVVHEESDAYGLPPVAPFSPITGNGADSDDSRRAASAPVGPALPPPQASLVVLRELDDRTRRRSRRGYSLATYATTPFPRGPAVQVAERGWATFDMPAAEDEDEEEEEEENGADAAHGGVKVDARPRAMGSPLVRRKPRLTQSPTAHSVDAAAVNEPSSPADTSTMENSAFDDVTEAADSSSVSVDTASAVQWT